MSDFKPGNRVRVIGSNIDPLAGPMSKACYEAIGKTGEIVRVDPIIVNVEMGEGKELWLPFCDAELAMLPPEPAEEPLFEGEFWFVESSKPEYGCAGFLYEPRLFKNNQGKGIRVRVTEIRE